MKVRYIGKSEPKVITNGKIYEVISIDDEKYRIVDDTNDDYLYAPDLFEVVE